MENAMKNSMKWAVLFLTMPLLAACGDDAAIAEPEPCQAGFFSADGLEPCAAATECEATEYEVRAPSETSDRQCESLTLCSLEEFESLAPTSTSDRKCSPLTICKFNEAEISPPTPTSDRECEKLTNCDDDSYEIGIGEDGQSECALLTVCGENEYEATAPTATSDRVCATNNTPPVANGLSLFTEVDLPLAITLSGSDVDGDTLSFIVKTQPTHGQLSGTPPQLIYTPNAGFVGGDSFTFAAHDGEEESAPATVMIAIEPAEAETYTVGGTYVTPGFANGGYPVLENNGIESLTVNQTSFEFPTPLPDGASYEVTVKSDPPHRLCSVQNGKGVIQGADVDDVELACRRWGGSEWVPGLDDIHQSIEPQLAFDGEGNAIVVWLAQESSSPLDEKAYSVAAIHYTRATDTWSESVDLFDSRGLYERARRVRIAMNASGDAFVVWQRGNDYDKKTNTETLELIGRYYDAAEGVWGPEQTLGVPSRGSLWHEVGMDHDGNVILAASDRKNWTSPYETTFRTFIYNRANDIWSESFTLEDGPSSPHLKIAANGRAVLAWRLFLSGGGAGVAAMAMSSPGEGAVWGPAQELGLSSPQFDLAIDSEGNAAVLVAQPGVQAGLGPWVAQYRVDTGNWTEPVQIAVAFPALRVHVTLDDHGNITALWHWLRTDRIDFQTREDFEMISATRYEPALGWKSPVDIYELPRELNDLPRIVDLQLADDNAGNAMFAYRLDGYLYARRYSAANGSWDGPIPALLQAPLSTHSGVLAFDSLGNGLLLKVYRTNEGWSVTDPYDLLMLHFR